MPITPFHFGLNSCIALPLSKYIDFPVFILVNCIIDLEPLIVILFNLRYPVHGYCHTLLIGSFVGVLSAVLFYLGKDVLRKLMNFLRLSYETNFKKILISAILGIWLHVLLDALLYTDIRPFYPLTSNPLYDKIGFWEVYLICSILFIPAFLLYKNRVLKTTTS